MSHPGLSIVIPAAGASKRLGQAKQLLRYGNGTLIQRAVDIAQSINPGEIIVVTGAYEKAVREAVVNEQVRWVHNPDWSTGMGSSIACGAAALSSGAGGVMILLVDQWRLQVADLGLLAVTWQSKPDRIVCALARHKNMPPVIFPQSCFGQLQSLSSDIGARHILGKHPRLLTPVPLENAQFDVDTQAHLEQLKNANL